MKIKQFFLSVFFDICALLFTFIVVSIFFLGPLQAALLKAYDSFEVQEVASTPIATLGSAQEVLTFVLAIFIVLSLMLFVSDTLKLILFMKKNRHMRLHVLLWVGFVVVLAIAYIFFQELLVIFSLIGLLIGGAVVAICYGLLLYVFLHLKMRTLGHKQKKRTTFWPWFVLSIIFAIFIATQQPFFVGIALCLLVLGWNAYLTLFCYTSRTSPKTSHK